MVEVINASELIFEAISAQYPLGNPYQVSVHRHPNIPVGWFVNFPVKYGGRARRKMTLVVVPTEYRMVQGHGPYRTLCIELMNFQDSITSDPQIDHGDGQIYNTLHNIEEGIELELIVERQTIPNLPHLFNCRFSTKSLDLFYLSYLNSDKNILTFHHDVLLTDGDEWFIGMRDLIKDLAYIALKAANPEAAARLPP